MWSNQLTVTKGYNTVQRIEDDKGIHSLVAIKFCKILDFGDPSLVEFKVVLFESQSDLFQDIVNDGHLKVMMEFAQLGDYVGEEVEVAEFDLPGL